VSQRASGIVVSGAPMLLHAEARELVILGMAFVALCAVDQMNDVVDFAIGGSAEQLLRAYLDQWYFVLDFEFDS
jgi:hypothetical protein